MKFENYVCYKDKYDNIKSLGVEIDSILLNDERSLNNSNDMIGGGKEKNKKLFRANLGLPLPLLLIQEEAENLYNIIHNNSNTKKDDLVSNKKRKKDLKKEKTEKITCVSNNLFDHLIDLHINSKKNKKQSRKNKRKKSNKKTRKNKSFF
jgi:hypothetical protein